MSSCQPLTFNRVAPSTAEHKAEPAPDLPLQVVPISIPELDAARVAHMYTFGSEAASCHMQALQTPCLKRQMAADVRVTLGISQSFKAQQFVQAQRIRSRMATYMEKAFEAVDFIVTPTIPDTAPPIQ